MDRFYESSASLFVRAYDAFYRRAPAPIAGDVEFYEGLDRATGGPVLELACGTGRIALPLAERGLDITGVDASDGMLAIAQRKRAVLPAAARQRLTLVSQDMTELALDRRFGCIFVAFRSFQHLLTVELQRKALAATGIIWRPMAVWRCICSIRDWNC
jgi:ubiquinone/menaquinone biosynthesis C-methylase UbiE